MKVETTVFQLAAKRYRSLEHLARGMGLSLSEVSRVRRGQRGINQKFIFGALKAFPDKEFDDLFYLTAELPNGKLVTTPGKKKRGRHGKAGQPGARS